MKPRNSSAQPVKRLQPIDDETTAARSAWAPTRGHLFGAVLVLAATWASVLASLTEVFASGPWLVHGLMITTVSVAMAGALRIMRPRMRAAAGLVGAGAGFVYWSWWFTSTGRHPAWWREPSAMIEEIRWSIVDGDAPLEVNGALQDMLLLLVALAVAMTVLVLFGLGHPVLAGGLAALLLLVPSAVTGVSVGWPTLAGVGALLAALVWLGSPSPNLAGAISAAIAIAVAAGAMSLAPETRDRVWNDALFPAPVSDAVPDVTIALADDLRQRGDAQAFTFTSTRPGPYRFTLATLAEFTEGRWQPQGDVNTEGLTVADPRSDASLPPVPLQAPPEETESTVTVTVDGLLSSWLPLPQSTVRVVEAEDPSGFAPEHWQWTTEANTARTEESITRRGDRYSAEARSLLADDLPEGSIEALPPDAVRLIPSAPEAPAGLDAYLELPAGLPETVTASAEEAAGAAESRVVVGFALQEWFRGGDFVYDESAPYQPGADPEDPYAVMEGLLTERSGFCVHYASTFAVMARALGAPARVSVGYASRAAESGSTTVRGRELHAWPEIYIDGAGWMAFEPTPGGAGVRDDTDEDVPAVPEDSDAPEDEAAAPTPPPASSEDEEDGEVPGTEEPGDSEAADGSDTGAPAFGAVAVRGAAVLTLALLLLPAASRTFRRHRRRRAIAIGRSPARHAWAEFTDTAIDLGLLASSTQTPGPRARTAEALLDYFEARQVLSDESASAARLLADAMIAERYDPHPEDDGCEAGVPLRTATAALHSAASRRERVLALCVPRSMFRRKH